MLPDTFSLLLCSNKQCPNHSTWKDPGGVSRSSSKSLNTISNVTQSKQKTINPFFRKMQQQ